MIKIHINEIDKHRNETTFRPYILAYQELKEIGIELIWNNPNSSYDYVWIGQASFMDKKLPLAESTEMGLKYLQSVTGDYMLFDGQDATTIIGSYEVFKNSKALLLLKNTLLKDRNLYTKGWKNGRYYWGQGDYLCSSFHQYSDRIKLSGTNWLSTIPKPKYFNNIPKINDVCALFGYPSATPVYEHNLHQSKVYDEHRKPCVDVVNKLKCKVAQLKNGVRLSPDEYYNTMAQSKIILAPFGYGEMAPRDIEAIAFGSILIKPNMDYIDSNPMWYENGLTYISCKHDYSDLEEKIDYVLSNYSELQQTMIPYARNKFDELYTKENTAINVYNIKNLKGVEIE